MFGPHSKELTSYYPSMMEETVQAETIANQVYWRERTAAEEIFDDLAYQKIELSEELQELSQIRRQIAIQRLKNSVERIGLNIHLQFLKADYATQILGIKLKHQAVITGLRVKYHPVVSTVRYHGPEIAWLVGIGSAARMAFATEGHLLNGDPGKAVISAGIGVASLAAPYLASKYFGKKQA